MGSKQLNISVYLRFQDEPGRFPNSRGFSCLFGPDVTSRFLADNKLLYIVRSHECVQYGYDLTHEDQVRMRMREGRHISSHNRLEEYLCDQPQTSVRRRTYLTTYLDPEIFEDK